MSQYPHVAVVILNYNGQHYLEQFLPSVLASTYPNFTIIVGDNASTDGSIAFLTQHYPEIAIIRNTENYGFAGGYNKILAQVKADYFVLLNSDVAVTTDWINPVIELMESDKQIAACQPKIRSFANTALFEYAGAAGGFIDAYGFAFCRGRIFDTVETDNEQYNTPSEVFWASGAALFIRANVYTQAGGLDADFFAHMEEIDLCWRLKNKGFKIMYCPYSIVYHVGGGTLDYDNPRKVYLNFRNNLFMMVKNIPGAWNAFFILFIRFLFDFAALLQFVIKGKWQHVFAINKAHTHFLAQLPKLINKRLKVQKELHTPNYTGKYTGSIVYAYFIKKTYLFSQLLPSKFQSGKA